MSCAKRDVARVRVGTRAWVVLLVLVVRMRGSEPSGGTQQDGMPHTPERKAIRIIKVLSCSLVLFLTQEGGVGLGLPE